MFGLIQAFKSCQTKYTVFKGIYIHWKIKLGTAAKPPLAVERHFMLTNNYSTIITRPRGMWFQLTAHLCSLGACNFFFPKLMKEQIVVDMDRVVPLNSFKRFCSISKTVFRVVSLTHTCGFLSIYFFWSTEKLISLRACKLLCPRSALSACASWHAPQFSLGFFMSLCFPSRQQSLDNLCHLTF